MTVTGLDTVTRWLLSFGKHAMPLSPKRFVTRIRHEVDAMMKCWEKHQ